MIIQTGLPAGYAARPRISSGGSGSSDPVDSVSRAIPRRTFLKWGALAAVAAGAGSMLNHTLGQPQPGKWENIQRYPVVVVGGGISGIYSAWRLKGCDGSTPMAGQVAVFEKSVHIGGRIKSMKVAGTDKFAELGAMRYVPARHHLVRTLVEDKLKLPTREFPVGGPNTLTYVRGKRMRNEDIAKDPGILPYNLAPNEKGKSPDELIMRAIDQAVPGAGALSEAGWRRLQETGAVNVRNPITGAEETLQLNRIGFQNVLYRGLSSEAYQMITDTVGYDTVMANTEAIAGIQEFVADFAPDTSYRTLVNGMMDLPNTLKAQFEEAGGEIHLRHDMQDIQWDADRRCFVMTFDANGEKKTVLADKVILAMPQKPLQQLAERNTVLNRPELRSMLGTVRAFPMTRIIARYKNAWWRDEGITHGRSTTDLPLRMVYYYGGEQGQDGFVMVYNDGAHDEFWSGYQDPQDPGSVKRFTPSSALAEEVQKQLGQLHGREIPAPAEMVYRRWAGDTYGGAFHSWNPGTRPWEVAARMLQPEAAIPLYICGEAFSQQQGWIEGALNTAEQVLDKLGKPALGKELPRFNPPQAFPALRCTSCHR